MSVKSWMKSNSLINSAIWYTIGSFILKGVNFFTVPIFANLLSLDEMGIITIYSTWSGILSIIVGLGINGTIGSARANLNDNEYKEYLSSTLFLGTISFVVIGLITLIFNQPVANIVGIGKSLIIILLLESFFSFVINFVTTVFTFERNHKAFLFTSAIVTIVNVVLSLILVINIQNYKYVGRIYGGAIATIIVGIVLYIKIIRKGKKLIDLKYWKFCLPIAIPLIAHNLSHLVLNQADKIMLQKMTTDEVVGMYGTIYTIGALINTVQVAINSAWTPWYFDTLKSKDGKQMRKVSAIYIAVFTLLTIMFILGSPEIVKIMYPKAYWSGIKLLPIIIAGYYFVFLYTFPANYQFYIKETRFIALGTFIAALINVVINFLLIPIMGMYAAAISTLVAYIVLFFMHYLIVKVKFKHVDFPFTFNLYGILAVGVTSIICYVALDNFIIRWLIIIGILSIVTYIILKNFKNIKNIK